MMREADGFFRDPAGNLRHVNTGVLGRKTKKKIDEDRQSGRVLLPVPNILEGVLDAYIIPRGDHLFIRAHQNTQTNELDLPWGESMPCSTISDETVSLAVMYMFLRARRVGGGYLP